MARLRMNPSLDSATVNPLQDRRWLWTLALTKLQSACISRDDRPSRSSSSNRPQAQNGQGRPYQPTARGRAFRIGPRDEAHSRYT